MSLKAQMALDADLFTNSDDFGEEVIWTPKGQAVLVDPVPIAFHQGTMMVNGQQVAIESEAMILVRKSLVGDVSLGAAFVRADGKTWTIDRSGGRGADSVFWRLECHLDPVATLRSGF